MKLPYYINKKTGVSIVFVVVISLAIFIPTSFVVRWVKTVNMIQHSDQLPQFKTEFDLGNITGGSDFGFELLEYVTVDVPSELVGLYIAIPNPDASLYLLDRFAELRVDLDRHVTVIVDDHALDIIPLNVQDDDGWWFYCGDITGVQLTDLGIVEIEFWIYGTVTNPIGPTTLELTFAVEMVPI